MKTALLVLSPLLLAVAGPLGILARNVGEVNPIDAGRLVLVISLITLTMLLIIRIIVRDWEEASILTTILILLFITYGQLYLLLRDASISGQLIGRHRFLFPIWVFIGIAGVVFVNRRLKRKSEISSALAVVSILVFSFAAIGLGRIFEAASLFNSISAAPVPAPAVEGNPDALPDVYYIVLDGYARADILEAYYDFDNNEFLDELRSRGFYIADKSHSNYSLTLLSLPSSLNMGYLDSVAEDFAPNSGERAELTDMIRHSLVRQIFTENGYRMIAFETGTPRSRIRDVDIYLLPETVQGPFNAFELNYLETTLVKVVMDLYILRSEAAREWLYSPEFEVHRQEVLHTFEELRHVPARDGAYFVFAHVVSPHPPFVFGSNGERRFVDHPYRLEDGSSYSGTQDEYMEGYLQQLQFVNKQILEALDQIQADSEPAPIIILQSDHGPGAFLDWQAADEDALRERMSILNAYAHPVDAEDELYPTITPVNSFRVLFNSIFDSDYALLEDNIYFSTPRDLISWLDVTRVLD